MLTGDRCTLHLKSLKAFVAWAETKGYRKEPTKGTFEILRLRHADGGIPILFFTKIRSKEHVTCQRDGLKLVRRWLRERSRD